MDALSFDRADFLATITKRAGERTANLMPMLRVAQAVGPVMKALQTGNDVWDRYLTHLAGYIAQANEAKATAQAKLADPNVWDTNMLTKLKSDILVCEAMTEAWTLAMNLPKALIEGSELASQEIARFNNAKPATAPGA